MAKNALKIVAITALTAGCLTGLGMSIANTVDANNLRDHVAETDEDVAAVNEDLVAKVTDLLGRLADVKSEVKALETLLNEKNSEREAIEAALDEKLSAYQRASNEGDVELAGQISDVIAALNTAKTELGGQITNLTTELNTLKGRVTTAEGKITDLLTRMGTAEGKISDLLTRMGTAEGSLTSLDGRVDTIEDQINTAVTGILARLTKAEGDISGLNTRLTTAEGEIDQLQTDLAALKGRFEAFVEDLALQKTLASRLLTVSYDEWDALDDDPKLGAAVVKVNAAWKEVTDELEKSYLQPIAWAIMKSVKEWNDLANKDGFQWIMSWESGKLFIGKVQDEIDAHLDSTTHRCFGDTISTLTLLNETCDLTTQEGCEKMAKVYMTLVWQNGGAPFSYGAFTSLFDLFVGEGVYAPAAGVQMGPLGVAADGTIGHLNSYYEDADITSVFKKYTDSTRFAELLSLQDRVFSKWNDGTEGQTDDAFDSLKSLWMGYAKDLSTNLLPKNITETFNDSVYTDVDKIDFSILYDTSTDGIKSKFDDMKANYDYVTSTKLYLIETESISAEKIAQAAALIEAYDFLDDIRDTLLAMVSNLSNLAAEKCWATGYLGSYAKKDDTAESARYGNNFLTADEAIKAVEEAITDWKVTIDVDFDSVASDPDDKEVKGTAVFGTNATVEYFLNHLYTLTKSETYSKAGEGDAKVDVTYYTDFYNTFNPFKKLYDSAEAIEKAAGTADSGTGFTNTAKKLVIDDYSSTNKIKFSTEESSPWKAISTDWTAIQAWKDEDSKDFGKHTVGTDEHSELAEVYNYLTRASNGGAFGSYDTAKKVYGYIDDVEAIWDAVMKSDFHVGVNDTTTSHFFDITPNDKFATKEDESHNGYAEQIVADIEAAVKSHFYTGEVVNTDYDCFDVSDFLNQVHVKLAADLAVNESRGKLSHDVYAVEEAWLETHDASEDKAYDLVASPIVYGVEGAKGIEIGNTESSGYFTLLRASNNLPGRLVDYANKVKNTVASIELDGTKDYLATSHNVDSTYESGSLVKALSETVKAYGNAHDVTKTINFAAPYNKLSARIAELRQKTAYAENYYNGDYNVDNNGGILKHDVEALFAIAEGKVNFDTTVETFGGLGSTIFTGFTADKDSIEITEAERAVVVAAHAHLLTWASYFGTNVTDDLAVRLLANAVRGKISVADNPSAMYAVPTEEEIVLIAWMYAYANGPVTE